MDETDKKIEVNSTEEKMYTKEEAIAAIEQTQIPAESFSYTYEDTEILELSTIPLDFECHLDVDRLYN